MPLAKSWLDWEEAAGGRATLKGTPEEIRGMYDQLVQALIPMMPAPNENVNVVEGDVDGIKYRTYAPKEGNGPFPIAIWTHGGGYMTGDLNSDELLCRVVSDATKSAVVNVDYRLAPEHKWPAQLDDSVKLYKWARENASSFKGDASKMYTIGGSAGGALAFQVRLSSTALSETLMHDMAVSDRYGLHANEEKVALQVLKDPTLKPSLKGIAAMVPCTTHWDNVPEKYKSKYKAYEDNAKDAPVIDKESMEIFYKHVGADPKDPETFTILATDMHKEFPPTYFTSCEFDPLRDDAYVMEAALKEAGVPTKHDHYEGMPHYFWIFPPVPEGQTYVGNLIQGIEWLKGQM